VLPETSNFFATLHTPLSRESVADLYRDLGWSVRKCGWLEFEIESAFAAVVIESVQPILMHGAVDDVASRAVDVVAPLVRAGVRYEAEYYDEGGELVRVLGPVDA
jgi:hypothetical protein